MLTFYKSLDKKKQENKSSENGTSSDASPAAKGKPALSKAALRMQSDLRTLDEDLKNMWSEVKLPDADNLQQLQIIVRPREGFYRGGVFQFDVTIPDDYPQKPPKVLCNTKVYHPNIDPEGHVCVNILSDLEWTPVASLKDVVYGVEFLFREPNTEDPLHQEAADLLKQSPAMFEQKVRRYIRGQTW